MALTREQFNKLRASGLSTEQIINFERGYVPEKKETFLQGLGRDIASPFVRGAELVGSAASLTGSATKSLVQNKLGDKAGAKETMTNALKKAEDRTTAKVNVFGREEAPITTTKQAIGAGLEVGSNLIGGGAAKNVFQTGLKTGLKTLAKQGAKEGLATGLTYGLGTGLQGEGNFGQVAKETALGGVTGLVGGAVLAPVIGAGEKGLFKMTNYGIKSVKNVAGAVNKKIKGVVTADDIEKELLNIETGYAKTRKMMDFSKDAGSATRKRLISADVLSDVTDDAGIVRTKTPGGAKDQYKAKTIDGTEGLVRETLIKEGKTVSPDVLKGKMINDIMNSGLEGKALRTALNNVDGEVEGLMLRAAPNGEIPLNVIHDAKISTTNSIDFNTEAFVKTERKANAGSYKRIIEETSDEPIEAINKELQKDYKVLELLDVLDGKRVKGGKLGKYFSQIGGNIVGGAVGSVGGPFGSAIGSVVGGEVAGKIKGQMLKNTFGQSIGSTIEKSGILVEASNKVKAPRLLLPAPKPGSPRSSLGSGPTINLPSKTQSTLDNAYSYNLGKRNTMYNTPNTTIKKPIKLKSNNNTPSLTNKKQPVKLKPGDVSLKGKGETLKSSLVQEAKKYKSAEEFVKSQEVFYHGTPEKFTEFNNTVTPNFFTKDKNYANVFTDKKGGKGNLMERYLDIKKPFDPSVDKNAVDIYNNQFLPYISKFEKDTSLLNPIKLGDKVPFKNSEDLFRFLRSKKRTGELNFDGLVVDEKASIVGFKNADTSYIPIDTSSIKTKSQLISEWNKARPLKKAIDKASNQTYYHGTNSTFDNFVKQVKAGVSNKATAQPIFLTNDIKTAKAFSQSNTGRIIETKIAPDTKIFDPMSLVKKGEYIEESSIFSKIKSYFKKDGISSDKADELTRQVFDPFNSYGAIEKPSFQRWLTDKGFDGFIVREGTQGGSVQVSTGIINLDKIKIIK